MGVPISPKAPLGVSSVNMGISDLAPTRGAHHRPADVAQTTWDIYASLPRQGPDTPA